MQVFGIKIEHAVKFVKQIIESCNCLEYYVLINKIDNTCIITLINVLERQYSVF